MFGAQGEFQRHVNFDASAFGLPTLNGEAAWHGKQMTRVNRTRLSIIVFEDGNGKVFMIIHLQFVDQG